VKAKLERLIVLAVLLVASLLARTTIADLVAYYPFNEGSGTTAEDASGNGHDSSVSRDVQWINSKSGHGKALYFRGENATGHVDCGTWNPSELTGQLTVALWIRWDGLGGAWQGPISKRNNWAADRMAWQVGVNRDSQQIAFYREGSYPNCGDCVLPKGEWTHVAATFDGTTVVFYMNGKVTGRGGFSFGSDTDASVIIGAADPGGLDTFHGALDEVCIFNNALSENDIIQLYNMGGASFVSPSLLGLLNSVDQARRNAEKRPPQEAVALFEKKIAEYELWEKENPKHVGLRSEFLASDLHFFLAKAKKAADASTSDIAEAYMKSALTSSKSQNYVPALLWLSANLSANDYIEFVRKCKPNDEGAFDNIHLIARNFEASRDWGAFKLFLDGNFAEVNDTTAYAKAIAEGLSSDGVWANKFLKYCRGKPKLTEYFVGECERLAQGHVEEMEFSKAVEIYRDLASQCGSDQDESVYELKACECIFSGGQHSRALSELDGFIDNNKSTNKALPAKAMLLKGHIYMQSGELDRASDIFSKTAAKYPQSKQATEANFFIGYCLMLQGEHAKAAEALRMVVKCYPQSSYAGRARLCLMRVERMRR